MSAFEKKLREAAGKFKSFPDAVSAHLRNAFDRGATDVKISYNDADEGSVFLMIEDNGRPLTRDQFVAITNPSPEPRDAYELLALTGAHHARMLTVDNAGAMRTVNFSEYDESKPERYKQLYPRVVQREGSLSKSNVAVQLWYLSAGDGVDPRQDRTAARLVKRLPAMLSVGEAGMVCVVDEKGTSTRLTMRSRVSKRGDYVIWVPGISASFDRRQEPMVLKYGGVRVPLAGMFTRIRPPVVIEHAHVTIPRYLHSPWISGTIEVTRKDGATEFPDPLDDFPEASYESGFVHLLGDVLVESNAVDSVRDAILSAGQSILDSIVPSRRPITFQDRTFVLLSSIGCGRTLMTWKPAAYNDSARDEIWINVVHPLFQLDNRSEAIRERIIWTIAEELHGHHKLAGPVSGSYLALRAAIDKARG